MEESVADRAAFEPLAQQFPNEGTCLYPVRTQRVRGHGQGLGYCWVLQRLVDLHQFGSDSFVTALGRDERRRVRTKDRYERCRWAVVDFVASQFPQNLVERGCLRVVEWREVDQRPKQSVYGLVTAWWARSVGGCVGAGQCLTGRSCQCSASAGPRSQDQPGGNRGTANCAELVGKGRPVP